MHLVSRAPRSFKCKKNHYRFIDSAMAANANVMHMCGSAQGLDRKATCSTQTQNRLLARILVLELIFYKLQRCTLRPLMFDKGLMTSYQYRCIHTKLPRFAALPPFFAIRATLHPFSASNKVDNATLAAEFSSFIFNWPSIASRPPHPDGKKWHPLKVIIQSLPLVLVVRTHSLLEHIANLLLTVALLLLDDITTVQNEMAQTCPAAPQRGCRQAGRSCRS